MKTLTEILSEKLHLNKNYKKTGVVKIPIPYVENGDYAVEDPNNIWKTLDMPNDKYIICKDKYRHDLIMFTTLTNLLVSILQLEDCYEDWNVKEDVLFSSDDLNETIEWYIKYLDLMPKFDSDIIATEGDGDQLQDWIENKNLVKTKNCKDSSYFLADLMRGKITEKVLATDDEYFGAKNGGFDLSKLSPEDFPEWAHKYIK